MSEFLSVCAGVSVCPYICVFMCLCVYGCVSECVCPHISVCVFVDFRLISVFCACYFCSLLQLL